MKLDELDNKHLARIIELQSCIIQGRDIRAILHKYMNHFRTDTQADIIALCLKEENHVDLRFILEQKRTFVHLLKKYFPERKKTSWSNFIEHCEGKFLAINDYLVITDFNQFFKGFLSKNDSFAMNKELDLRQAIIMPLYNRNINQKIGFVFYIFQQDINPRIDELKKTTTVFQNIFQPLYDREDYTLYSKCVRVNNEMKLLTPQEKKIVKKVVDGLSYPEVAQHLSISINTLKTHMKSIFIKYGVRSKIELYKKLNANH